MAKKIFVSASSGEAAVSRALITALSNAFEGDLTFANSAVDMGAGDKWKAWMRSNLKDCDAGLFLLTPAYNKSPWSSAEFTAFWLDEKPIFLLMAGAIDSSELFQPMQDDHQATHLSDIEGLKRFIKNLSDFCGRERTPFEFTEVVSYKCLEAYEASASDRVDLGYSFDPEVHSIDESQYEKRHKLFEATWDMSLNEDKETLRGVCTRTEHVVCQSGIIHYANVAVAQAANIVPFDPETTYSAELLEYERPNGRVSIVERKLTPGGDFSFRVRFVPPLTRGDEARFTYRFTMPSLKAANTDLLRELLQANPDMELRNFESFVIQVLVPTDRFIYAVNFTGDCLVEPEIPDVTWRRGPFARETAALLAGDYTCTTSEDGGVSMRLDRERPLVDTRYGFKWKLPRRADLE